MTSLQTLLLATVFFITSAMSVVTGSTSMIGVAVFSLSTAGRVPMKCYVTILTALFVALFRMTFLEVIAVTKVLNIFSSAVATGVFMWNGLVGYRLGLLLAAVMFAGAMVSARYALRVGNLWLRRIYLTAVWVLGLKAILIDLMHLDGQRAAPSTPTS